MKTLFVAWQQQNNRGWYPVGRLDADVSADYYRFRYLQGAIEAAEQCGFVPFDSFPDIEGDSVSSELFPFFANRLQNSNQPGFGEYLRRLDLATENGEAFDPIEVLAVSEGRRATDNLEIFPRVTRTEGRPFTIKTFAARRYYGHFGLDFKNG